MSLHEVSAALDEIGAASGNAKLPLLKKHLEDEMFALVVHFAYNPFKTFGVAEKTIAGLDGFETANDRGIEPVDYWRDFFSDLADRVYTGTRAVIHIEDRLAGLTPHAGDVVLKVLLKDLRCGINISTINKARKDFIPVFKVMLAHKFEEKRIGQWPAVVEPKLDGFRVIAMADTRAGEVKFLSRTGKEYTSFNHLVEPILDLHRLFDAHIKDDDYIWSETFEAGRFVLEGEMVSGSFNETASSARRKDVDAVDAEFHCFDILPYGLFSGEFDEWDYSYNQRRKLLEHFLGWPARSDRIKPVPRYLVHSVEEIMGYYERVRARGLEGLIVKPADGRYEKKRSRNWLKIKGEETLDLCVIGAFEGTGKYEGKLGGLIVQHGNVEVRVGGGFSDAQREEFWECFQDDIRREQEADFYSRSKAAGSILGRIIEVEFHEETADGSLRHPRFVRFRDDKQEAE